MKTDWITKGLLVFVGSGLWAMALMHGADRVNAQSPTVPNEIKAQKFVVVDGNGNPKAFLGTFSEGTASGTGLAILDAKGGKRVELGVLNDGSSGLAISNAQGKRAVGLGVDNSGNQGIVINDAQGNELAHLP